MPNYEYVENGGIVLNVIKGSPNNITLKRINQNVVASGEYGINGGFFYGSDLLSIAINNDVPVNGSQGAYGSGWFNHAYDRGTLVWDATKRAYSVQIVGSAGQIAVADRSNYWAQGGISMSLQDDAHWVAIAQAQNMPNMAGATQRVGLVWNTGMNIWLVLSETACSASQFRLAIKAQLGSGTMVDGIFLDGGGSAQMNCTQNKFSGDLRSVVQMVALTTK